jgi:hypothetical protein
LTEYCKSIHIHIHIHIRVLYEQASLRFGSAGVTDIRHSPGAVDDRTGSAASDRHNATAGDACARPDDVRTGSAPSDRHNATAGDACARADDVRTGSAPSDRYRPSPSADDVRVGVAISDRHSDTAGDDVRCTVELQR